MEEDTTIISNTYFAAHNLEPSNVGDKLRRNGRNDNEKIYRRTPQWSKTPPGRQVPPLLP